ncbi:MAG: carbonic anhydrase [Clostridia bacterium]|nr:carbonic anhydrase [Clostridia bacterium]
MNEYKNLIKSRSARMRILAMLGWLPDKAMLKLQYRVKLHRKLNLKNPKRFTEKIQWYKVNYRNSVMHTCVDKYDVREYIKSKGLENILIDLYGVYDSIDNVDFNLLPESFILKSTDGSGGINVFLCNDKSALDVEKVKAALQVGYKLKKKHPGREWAYNGLKHKIIAEKLLVNEKNPEAGIDDYKIFCFNGEPKCIVVDTDRYIGHKRNFYDTEWNDFKVTSDAPACDREIQKPENLEEMLEVARTLSSDFPFVRVDLYNVGGKIYFGELTFYPWSGYVQYYPDNFDFDLGEYFVLPENN